MRERRSRISQALNPGYNLSRAISAFTRVFDAL
jgi:hypothetical protein